MRRFIDEDIEMICSGEEPRLLSELEPKAPVHVVVSTPLVIEDGACQICGKKDHQAYQCPFMSFVPVGSCVGPGYAVICKGCGQELVQPVGPCPWLCRSPGRATHKYCFICKAFAHHWPSECPHEKDYKPPSVAFLHDPHYISPFAVFRDGKQQGARDYSQSKDPQGHICFCKKYHGCIH